MSAYLVEDAVINRIVGFLSYHREDRRILEMITQKTGIGDSEKLATAMFALNVDAVEQRYGHGEAEQFRPLDYVYRPEVLTTRKGAYENLRTWLYQCSEGHVPTTTLFQAMTEVSNQWAHQLVRALSEGK